MNTIKSFYLVATLLIYFNLAFSQCESNNTTGVCSGGNGLLPNNAFIGGGTTYWWNSGTGSRTFPNFNGGTLVVCGGNLTINPNNLFSGTIIIQSGATLTINSASAELNGALTIINYATLNFTGNVIVRSSSARVFNNKGGTINISSGSTNMENASKVINNGTINTQNFNALNSNTSDYLCQGDSAITNITGNFTGSNNANNGIGSPSGSSCLSVQGDISMNISRPLSSTSDLNVCDGPAGTTSGNFGSASVTSNCTSTCSDLILPIELISISAHKTGNHVSLNWKTAQEINNNFYTIQRSRNSIDFDNIGQINGAGTSFTENSYIFIDKTPLNTTSYYRIIQTDFDGTSTISKITSLDEEKDISIVEVFYTSNNRKLQVILNSISSQQIKISFINMNGLEINVSERKIGSGKSTLTLPLDHLTTSGFYLVKVTTESKRFVSKNFYLPK